MIRCPLCHASIPNPTATLRAADPIHNLVPAHTEEVCRAKVLWLADLREREKAAWAAGADERQRIAASLSRQVLERWQAEK